MRSLTVPLASTDTAAIARAIDTAFGRILPWHRAAANSKVPHGRRGRYTRRG
ncbi:hypothetical protein AB5I41_17540 [Sphingomonas sp. MMS24-JH45]